MPFRFLVPYWRKRVVRIAVGLFVLVGAAIVQYFLANVRLPVDVGATNRFSPATVNLGQEELVINSPVVNPSEGLLLTHAGNPNEVLDINFDRARLGEESISLLEGLGIKPPAASGQIDYVTQNPQKMPVDSAACRTFIRIELRDASQPLDQVHFYQLETPGLDRYRHIEMKLTGGEIAALISTEIPPNGSPQAPGCRKLLRVGEWNQYLNGPLGVKIVADEGSTLRMRFQPVDAGSSLWGGPADFFEPFGLGSPKLKPDDMPSFQASGVSIRRLNSSGLSPDILGAQSTDEGSLLSVNGLKIGSDQLQISVFGKGRVSINGADQTVDLWERSKRYPIAALLIAAGNAALIEWLRRLFFSQRKTSTLETVSSESKSSRKRPKRKKA